MILKLKLLLLALLAACALWTAAEALGSMDRAGQALPQEVYSDLLGSEGQAEYFLREHEGLVAVFSRRRSREPVAVTGIELRSLRRADRAMILKGIPVRDRSALLALLEDLGS